MSILDPKANDYFESLYLEYFNNFLSVEGFAEYFGFRTEQAQAIIDHGRKIHKQKHQQ